MKPDLFRADLCVSLSIICVIDDDDDVRRVVCSALRRAGYATVEACDGKEGIKLVEGTNVGVVVTDIVMPNCEGLETIRELKARFPLVRILAISGAGRSGPADYLQLAMSFGADDCLEKPFSLDEFVTKVVKLTGASR